VSFDSEVRYGACGVLGRTSESGHSRRIEQIMLMPRESGKAGRPPRRRGAARVPTGMLFDTRGRGGHGRYAALAHPTRPSPRAMCDRRASIIASQRVGIAVPGTSVTVVAVAAVIAVASAEPSAKASAEASAAKTAAAEAAAAEAAAAAAEAAAAEAAAVTAATEAAAAVTATTTAAAASGDVCRDERSGQKDGGEGDDRFAQHV